ncbi:zinc ribbon domain-containing protein [Halobaculum halobium]|uniref:Zinc ribbon domain-containing protein n=1 Tax=Halobaculum halobium TaxID=3032281 RepID=A0ABD5TI36_9EURY|nr:zinc ribbon domain-containing protein [Halobaculum sp. SYNS20]
MQRRPVVAAALAVVPALGHAYLRRWTRGIAWLSLLTGSALVFAGVVGVGVGDALAASATWTGLASGSALVVPLGVVIALSSADAYVLARRDARRGALACPQCGRGVDLSLGFCWYCSVEFEYVER